jgi:MFS family permease
MKYSWSKTVLPISLLFAFRMLGLFLLIPIFTLYAAKLDEATPQLMGLALGAYGLTQGILQMPFGLLSDKFGRKPIIAIGLILFAAGSILGALSTTIYGLITARILQGSGAIGSVLIALLADLTGDEERTKAMAVIGMTIGTSFSLAMVLSPILSQHYGLSGVFYLTSILAFIGLMMLYLIVPTPARESAHQDVETDPSLLRSVLADSQLLRLNLGIFCQHAILTATFFVIPLILKQHMNEGHLTQQWHFYLLVIVLSFFAMVPFIILSEKKMMLKRIFLASILITGLTQAALAFSFTYWHQFSLLMFAYFVVFNVLEATLPSQISKQASASSKGTAMGIYSTCQFLGIFAGGTIAGFLYQLNSYQGVFAANALFSLIWLLSSLSMNVHYRRSTLILSYNYNANQHAVLISHLLQLPGTKEAKLSKTKDKIYLQIDKALYQDGSAEKTLLLLAN